MNGGMTGKEGMTVKEGILTSCCNEYLPRAVITIEMNNECRNDYWKGRNEQGRNVK